MSTFQWTDLDSKAVDTARVLAADAVEKVGNGHPGTAISLVIDIASESYMMSLTVVTPFVFKIG